MEQGQRQFDRIPAEFTMKCRRFGTLAESWRRVSMVNLGAGGVLFESDDRYEVGEPLELEVGLPGLRVPLLLRAQVVRASDSPSGISRCAAEFKAVTPDQQARIDEMVQFLTRTPPRS